MYLISYFDGLALTYRINVIESEPIYPLRPGKHSMELFLEDRAWPSLSLSFLVLIDDMSIGCPVHVDDTTMSEQLLQSKHMVSNCQHS